MPKIIKIVFLNTMVFYLASKIPLSVKLSGVEAALWAGILLGLVNMTIKPILFLLTLPVNFITLGLFTLVINTWMIMLVGKLTPGLKIPGFWSAFIISLGICAVNILFK